jgi:aromatic ring-opening dioxygenase catalytic subunit (LigB family)
MDVDADEASDFEFESEAVSARVQFDLGRTKTSSSDSNGQEGLVYPTLFISHGTPALVLQAHDPTHVFLRRLGAILPKPQYVIAVSAHWECNIPTVTASSQPAIVHDYLGFPQSLYELHYQLRGCPSMAADICQTLLEVLPSQP